MPKFSIANIFGLTQSLAIMFFTTGVVAAGQTLTKKEFPAAVNLAEKLCATLTDAMPQAECVKKGLTAYQKVSTQFDVAAEVCGYVAGQLIRENDKWVANEKKCWSQAKTTLGLQHYLIAAFADIPTRPFDRPELDNDTAIQQFRVLSRYAQYRGLSCPAIAEVCKGELKIADELSLSCSPVAQDGTPLADGAKTYSLRVGVTDVARYADHPFAFIKTTQGVAEPEIRILGGNEFTPGIYLRDDADSVEVVLDKNLLRAEVTFGHDKEQSAGSQLSCELQLENSTPEAQPKQKPDSQSKPAPRPLPFPIWQT